VSKAVASLLRSGLVEEADLPEPTGGRPATRLRLASTGAQVLGVVVDADTCRVVRAGLDGQLHDEPHSFSTHGTYADLIDSLARAARPLLAGPG